MAAAKIIGDIKHIATVLHTRAGNVEEDIASGNLESKKGSILKNLKVIKEKVAELEALLDVI